jgi:hypothetical protein
MNNAPTIKPVVRGSSKIKLLNKAAAKICVLRSGDNDEASPKL